MWLDFGKLGCNPTHLL